MTQEINNLLPLTINLRPLSPLELANLPILANIKRAVADPNCMLNVMICLGQAFWHQGTPAVIDGWLWELVSVTDGYLLSWYQANCSEEVFFRVRKKTQ